MRTLMNVNVSFVKLIHKIQPLTSEIARANSHRASITQRLLKSFKLIKVFPIGSHSRKSAIKYHSDVDLLAVFSRKDVKWGDTYISSGRFLDNIRIDLLERFWQTDIAKDKQAVVVSFGDGEYSVDVVPAIFWGMNDKKYPIYMIPDGLGDWIQTSPEFHNKYIYAADERSGGKLRRTAQLIKFWRECRVPRIPLSSFHLEILLAESRICEGIKNYPQCLHETFALLNDRECRAIRDPIGISGNIGVVKSEAQLETALNSVTYSFEHTKNALVANVLGNVDEAWRQWNIVFNGELPR